jgi:segregation and condensation protein B
MTEETPQPIQLIEAILFASAEPVTERALINRIPDGSDVPALLKELQEHYADRGVNLCHVGGSWALRTSPDLANALIKEVKVARRLSRAAMETLAILAYHQPVTRAEIEEIRGVGLSKGTLDILFELGWIRPRGRRRTPGRPVTWGTTDGFLDHFGIESVGDLPGMEELKATGLLDRRPAIHAYRNAGSGADRPPPGLEDGETAGDEEAVESEFETLDIDGDVSDGEIKEEFEALDVEGGQAK